MGRTSSSRPGNRALESHFILRLGCVLGLLVASSIGFAPPSLAQSASFQGLGFLPNSTASFATGISADGSIVVGYVQFSSGFQAFRWTNGAITALQCSASCMANGVNADGAVIVGVVGTQAARWVNGQFEPLGLLPGYTSGTATGVSADGTVVVGSVNNTNNKPQAFRWMNGVMSGLGFLPGGDSSTAAAVNADGTVIVGNSASSIAPNEAFRWVNGTMTGLGLVPGSSPPDNSSEATSVNSDGTVVGGSGCSVSGCRPFRWVNGKIHALFNTFGASSPANGVSADGTVMVGNGFLKFGRGARAWRWTPDSEFVTKTIEDLLSEAGVSFSGWQLTFATGISADGRVIVGNGIDPDGKQQGWIARLPVPPLPTNIFAAVAPNARTGTVGGPPVTGFASIINAGSQSASECSIALPGSVPAALHYRLTDAQNVPVGSQDTPVTIAAGGTQSFVFSLTPSTTFSQEIPLVFHCYNTAPAPSVPGLNTFLVSISTTPITDMLSIADTPTHDGIANIPGTTGTGLIVTAAVNIGAAGTVVFTPSDTPIGQSPRNLPVNLSICQTDSNTGACINPATPGASSTVIVTPNQTVFFSVFIQGKGTPIPFDPANSRVFIIGKEGTTAVGEASAAVRTH